MLLVALPEHTGEALAASGALSLACGYGSASLAVVCGRAAAPWFEEAPRRFWTLALSEPTSKPANAPQSTDSPHRATHRTTGAKSALSARLELQWRLYRRLVPCSISGLLDLGPYPALSALPAYHLLRMTRRYPRRVPPLWFRRQRGEAIEQALARLHTKALDELGEPYAATVAVNSPVAAPVPERFGVASQWQNAQHDRRAADLLPGGNTRPWVAIAPCFAHDANDTPFSAAFCEQICETLLFAGGALPEGRVAVLAAPGESTVAAQVASNFAELLGSERVANLAARTGLILAGAALARTTLVLSANRTAAQLAASVQVPCFVIERGASLPNEVALPLWARQEILSLPVADAHLAERFHSVLPVD